MTYLIFQGNFLRKISKVVGVIRIELMTSTMSINCSSTTSYTTHRFYNTIESTATTRQREDSKGLKNIAK